MTRIAVLGLGAMGSRLATNWLTAGYDVTVWNRSPQSMVALVAKGATAAHSPKAAAEQATIVVSMVTDEAASQAIWLAPETGAVWGLQPDAIAIESSTLTVAFTQSLATAIMEREAHFLDAPVVGSRPQADAQRLIYLVGGKQGILDRVAQVLGATSAAVHHIGAVGQGMAMKLAVNALFGIQVAALAEELVMLEQQGISRTTAMNCLAELPITSLAMKGVGHLMVKNDHAPLFPVSLVEKDLRYALQLAQAGQAAVPMASAVQQVFGKALAQGYGARNISSVFQLLVNKD